MKAFEPGKTYQTRSIVNSDSIITLTVKSRTDKTITTTTGKRLKIRVWSDVETVRPWGTYSMAPTISADREAANTSPTRTRYRNPWHDPTRSADPINNPEYFEHDKKPMFTHKGVQVFKVWERRYDYVLQGVCITQRCGASREVIDDIMRGVQTLSASAARLVRLEASPC